MSSTFFTEMRIVMKSTRLMTWFSARFISTKAAISVPTATSASTAGLAPWRGAAAREYEPRDSTRDVRGRPLPNGVHPSAHSPERC